MLTYLVPSPFSSLVNPSKKMEECYLKIYMNASFHNLIHFSPVILLFNAIFWDSNTIKKTETNK
jgi:hypothetical protein